MDVLTTHEQHDWIKLLFRSFQHDWFHYPFYHALAEARGEGTAFLFVHSEGDHFIAVPLLLRSLENVEGLSGAGCKWRDATSIYGYAGPVASHRVLPRPVIDNFQRALRDTLLEMRVISVFSRLHPLIPQVPLLEKAGDSLTLGETVSIDLTLSPEAQRNGIRRDHRRSIKRLRDEGLTCVHSQNGEYMPQFIEIYHETMRRVNADPAYFFDEDYFAALRAGLGPDLHLFMCLADGQPISGELITACDGIVQGYLAGTKDQYHVMAPTKLLIDYVRVWFSERGYRSFHLGGGVGARKDSLFYFKAGFSDLRHDFRIWRWVLNEEIYQALCEERRASVPEGAILSPGFFPGYRAPVLLDDLEPA